MKLGARLKRSFRRSKSDSAAVAPLVDPGARAREARNPPDAFEDALAEEVRQCLQSPPSTVSEADSLCSSARDHGPIDMDTCRKYKNRRGRVGGKRVNDRSRKENALPKIHEGISSPRSNSPPTAAPMSHVDGVSVPRPSPGGDGRHAAPKFVISPRSASPASLIRAPYAKSHSDTSKDSGKDRYESTQDRYDVLGGLRGHDIAKKSSPTQGVTENNVAFGLDQAGSDDTDKYSLIADEGAEQRQGPPSLPRQLPPSDYTSLEDAVASHEAMLTGLVGPLVGPGDSDTIKTTSATLCSVETEECGESVPSAETEYVDIRELLPFMQNINQEKLQTAEELPKQKEASSLKTNLAQKGKAYRTTKYGRRDSTDPPGVDQTNTRSKSPTPEFPNPFVEASKWLQFPAIKMPEASTPWNKPPPSTLAKTVAAVPFPDVSIEATDPATNAGKDCLEHEDLDAGVQPSPSDDSFTSYYSDMDLSAMTICEETTRLMEMRERYEADALTNMRHPSRQKRSIMKEGSVFRTTDWARASQRSKSKKGGRLTWYDDEENWSKPFLLRTDESWDLTSMTASEYPDHVHDILGRVSSLADGRAADFIKLGIKGIVRVAACGGEEDVVGFDQSGEQEI
ncbi:hypothetical protein ACHAXT_007511 [Thalassiosira profunda]